MFELFVAFRYLRAHRKQMVVSVVTLISVLGVTAGVAALIVALALNSGFQAEFQERILGTTSHVNLFSSGPGPLSGYRELQARIREIPGAGSVDPTVYSQSLLVSDLREQPAVLKGIDTSSAPDPGRLVPPLSEGSLEGFDAGAPVPPIILGSELAQSLGVLVGERIRAMGLKGELSPLGRMPRLQTFQVVAVFDSGLWQYDSTWALVPIQAAQRFAGLAADQVSTLELRIPDIYAAPELAARLRQQLGPGVAANTWIDLNRPLFSALELEKLAMFIAIGLIVLVASLNIVTSLTLLVTEKHRDIAIITAMGGTARTVMSVFMLQGLIIGVAGTILGSLLGSSAAWYFDRFRVFELEAQVYSIPYVPFQLNTMDLLLVCSLAVIISFLATLYPARSASRLDPVETFRYE